MPGQKRKAMSEAEAEAETRKQEIIAKIQTLDSEQTLAYLENLKDRWKLQYPNRSHEDLVLTAFEIFQVPISDTIDVTEQDSIGLREIDATIHTHEMEAIALYHHLRSHNLISVGSSEEDPPPDTDAETDPATTLNYILKVLEMVYYAKRLVLSVYQANIAIHQVHCSDLTIAEDIDQRLGSWSLRFRWIDSEDMNELQNLLLYLLDCAFEKQLRKQDGYVFCPIVVDGHTTHAFRCMTETKTWVYECCQKETQFQQWSNLTHGNNTIKAVVDYLNGCNDYQFPNLVKDRTVFSFKNGVYLASEDRFHPYVGSTEPLAASVVAAKYFEDAFDPYPDTNWRDIPTPAFHSILVYQELPEEASNWLYVFIGRLLYDLNTHDGWQVIPYIKGHAGTGKSTIVTQVCKNLYDPIDCGVMSNNIERKFGLSAFWDKFIFIGPECRNDLAIEQAEFQSIVSGEDVQVNIKHQKAFSTRWRVPGILAGNEIVQWGDSAGSIQRRLPVYDFIKPVLHGDMRLGDKIQAELPALLVKCNRAYREMADMHGSENIWTILPEYFQKTSSEVAQTINVLDAFLASDEVEFGPEQFCPFDEFKNGVTAFAQINGYSRPRFNADYFRGPFVRRGITRQKATKTWRNRVRTDKDFLIGVNLSESQNTNAFGADAVNFL